MFHLISRESRIILFSFMSVTCNYLFFYLSFCLLFHAMALKVSVLFYFHFFLSSKQSSQFCIIFLSCRFFPFYLFIYILHPLYWFGFLNYNILPQLSSQCHLSFPVTCVISLVQGFISPLINVLPLFFYQPVLQFMFLATSLCFQYKVCSFKPSSSPV